MAKYLKDVLKSKSSTTKKTNDLGGYKPKAGDEEKFAKKHDIEVTDGTGAPEHQFKGGTKVAAYKKQTDGVYESKKAEDVVCNKSPAGTQCPIHEMADCSSAKTIKEMSPQKMGDYVKSASADVGHKKADAAYARMSGDDKQADKLTNKARQRLGGIYTAVNKITREEVEQIDELSTDTYHRAANVAAKRAMGDAMGRSGPIFKKYAAKANKFRDAGMAQEKKEKAVKEGANVDRMVAHVKSSEKSAGKSDKKAESIAWATANKRGMLDNKNKKMEESYTKKLRDIVKEDLAVPLLQSEDATISYHNGDAHVKDHKGNVVAKYSRKTHGADWKQKAHAHMIRLRESDTPITFPGMNQDNAAGQNV